jgi:HEAT repeat protein
VSFLKSLFGPPDVENLKAQGKVNGLIKALEVQGEVRVRRDAANALGEIGDAQAVPPLIAALQDEDQWVRQNAVVALGKIRDDEAVESLVAALRDRSLPVRENAAWALGQIGDPRALGPVTSFLERQTVIWVRDVAARAVEKLKRAATRCTFCGKQLVEGRGVERVAASGDFDEAFAAMQSAAAEMLARRCVCTACGAIFCLECGNAEGHSRGTGKTHCAACGEVVAVS